MIQNLIDKLFPTQKKEVEQQKQPLKIKSSVYPPKETAFNEVFVNIQEQLKKEVCLN